MYAVSNETKLRIYESFGKTQRTVDQDVAVVKAWLKMQPHLPEITDDAKIRNFLLLNKFSIEKTKAKIDMYYTIRSLIPEYFDNANPSLPRMKEVLQSHYLSTHPKLVDGLHRVLFFKAKEKNVVNPVDMTIFWCDIFEVRLAEDCMVSDIMVGDMATMTFNDMTKVTPTMLTKFLAIYKKVYALRLKNLIYINCPSYTAKFVRLLKSIMKPKIFERVIFCPDTEVLKDLFDQESLPKDYGGDGPSLQDLNDMIQAKLTEHQERFDQLDLLRVNENLRPAKLNNDEILGYYGSFKKIDID